MNALEDVRCVGEAFNPQFIGYPKTEQIGGVTRQARDENPMRLLTAIKGFPNVLAGFRYFSDHDPRVLDTLLDDPRCAKVVLTRNPVDSYVSLKVARETGQWKLTNAKRRKTASIRFDPLEFEKHAARLQSFQLKVQHRLQISGQTAFYISYDDLGDLDVLNGLAGYLGSTSRLDKLNDELKKQNPAGLHETVTNFAEMEASLSALDAFNLHRTPNLEPRRSAAVPGFVTGARAALLYMPVRSGPDAAIRRWLGELDGVDCANLPSPRNQKALRHWKRRHIGHRSFTVLRHPVARVHRAFCDKILNMGSGGYSDIRKTLRNFFKIPLPGRIDDAYDLTAHREAFLGFVDFLKSNLAGQTQIRVDAHWASQAAVLQGMARFGQPDLLVREDEMSAALPVLAKQIGYQNPPAVEVEDQETPFTLSDIYDEEIESRVKEVYQRDYMMFGFGPWGS
ncbi:MAG: sulfotransferase family 2 domain-containing protein [Pseudomonadota bacterium]